MFETLRSPALALPPAPLLSLLATGTPTGVVVDCGHDGTTVTPVWRGRVVEAAAVRRDFGGHHLTARMLALLRDQAAAMGGGGASMAAMEALKEAHAFVSQVSEWSYREAQLVVFQSRPVRRLRYTQLRVWARPLTLSL